MTSSINYPSNTIRKFPGTLEQCKQQCKLTRMCTHFTHVDALSDDQRIFSSECSIKRGTTYDAVNKTSNFNSGVFNYRVKFHKKQYNFIGI